MHPSTAPIGTGSAIGGRIELGGSGARVLDPADLAQRVDEVDQTDESLRIALGQQPDAALQEPARRPGHRRARSPCGRPDGGEPPPDAASVVAMRVGRVELGAVAVRLLEVVADDLVELDELTVTLEPARKPLVQLGPRLLGQSVVRGVADQEVTETEGLVLRARRALRPDQLLANERQQVPWDSRSHRIVREHLHRGAVEHLSLDGAAADDLALPG